MKPSPHPGNTEELLARRKPSISKLRDLRRPKPMKRLVPIVLSALFSLGMLTSAAQAQSQTVPSFRVVALPSGFTANDVNDSGQVAGCYYYTQYTARAAVYSGGNVTDLGGGDGSCAKVINDKGDVAGITAAGHVFLWTGGSFQDLGLPPHFTTSYGIGLSDINDAGQIQIAGYAFLGQYGNQTEGFIWQAGQPGQPGTWTELYPDAANREQGIAIYAINDLGDVAGLINTYDAFNRVYSFGFIKNHDGASTNLSPLWQGCGYSGVAAVVPEGINDSGVVVGYHDGYNCNQPVAFVYTPPGPVSAGGSSQYFQSYAVGLTNDGRILEDFSSYTGYGFSFPDGYLTMPGNSPGYYLTQMVRADCGWTHLNGTRISRNAGNIIGRGLPTYQGFLMTPLSSPPQTMAEGCTVQPSTVPLTITAGYVTRPYGQANPALTASYSGFVGGDNPAVLSGALSCTTTATASSPVGNYPIMCSGQTSTKYNISYVPGQLSITPAPLTITANNATRPYGQANPVFTATYNGFVNGEVPSVLSGTLSCTSNATPSSPVNISSYAINCSGQSSTNYVITYPAGNLTITAVPLTITANNAARQYGAANPVFTPSYSGFVNGENSSVLAGTLSCTSAATPSSPVSGSPYAINCSGLTSANYVITYAAGHLAISPAPLTITANNATKILNAALPAFSASYSAFANGENSSVLTGTLNCTTTATASSPIGSYPINCSGQTSSNYAITFPPGILKIIYAPAGVCGHTILPPINADGSTVGNQGRVIPAKFQVCDANGVSIGTPGVVASFYLTQIITGTVMTTVQDIVDTNNPDTAFRWAGQQWIFNISTANLSAGSTYVYTITLNDGSTINFQYGLR